MGGHSFFAWINGKTCIVGVAETFTAYEHEVVGVASKFRPSHKGFKTRPAALAMVTQWVRSGVTKGHDESITTEEYEVMKRNGIDTNGGGADGQRRSTSDARRGG